MARPFSDHRRCEIVAMEPHRAKRQRFGRTVTVMHQTLRQEKQRVMRKLGEIRVRARFKRKCEGLDHLAAKMKGLGVGFARKTFRSEVEGFLQMRFGGRRHMGAVDQQGNQPVRAQLRCMASIV